MKIRKTDIFQTKLCPTGLKSLNPKRLDFERFHKKVLCTKDNIIQS